MVFFSSGYIQLKRENLKGIICDKNLGEREQWLLVKLIFFAWPYDFTMMVDDGQGKKASIDIKRGELHISTKELMAITGIVRQQTLTSYLQKLKRLGYINYQPAKNQFSERMYLKIINYEDYIESASTKTVEALQNIPNASTKTVEALPNASTKTVEALPNASIETVEAPPSASIKTVEARIDKSNNYNKKQLSNNIIKYVVNNKQQQENVVVEIQKLFKEKSNTELPKKVVRNLLKQSNEEKIKQNIKRLNFHNADNPVGLLISSIEEDWDLPVSVEEKIEADKKAREEEIKQREDYWKRTKEEALPPQEGFKKIKAIKDLLKKAFKK
jgi:hypothetical protein